MAPSPARLFRVVNGKCAGQIVAEDDTVLCEAEYGGCNGYGERFHRWHRSMGFGPTEQAYGETCQVCGGVGRVLGWPDGGHEVQRLQLVEDIEATRRGDEAGASLPRTPIAQPPSPGTPSRSQVVATRR